MKHVLVLIGLLALILEGSLKMAHPFMMTVPAEYFEQPERSTFLLTVILAFGVGQAVIPLVLKQIDVSIRMISMIIAFGLLDKWLFSSMGYILALGLGLLLARLIKKSWVGYLLLGIGVFIVAVPLLILFFSSETFMDAAKFQEIVSLYRSHDYLSYVTHSLMTDYTVIIATALFIITPLLLIDFSSMKYRVLPGIVLFSAGTILKTLMTQTESVLAFSILAMIGGLLQGIALYLILRGTANLAVVPAIIISSLMMMLAFTALGIGDYKNLAVEVVLMRGVVIFVVAVIIYFVFQRKMHANNSNILYNEEQT
ncbi:hypothetical protein [Macrococcus brunensis]|uniref:hypothetical protein n=1 Tax=Macrococcus brunensis TaxID=198483 RepID=UPI001EF0B81F|nr:hypothetical protein [Macrococcus brunensis]ULG74882.1 hypothetical protein MGG13_03720 [Macrococcus brunensis]